jgi:hypothetical protein
LLLRHLPRAIIITTTITITTPPKQGSHLEASVQGKLAASSPGVRLISVHW